LNQDFKNLTELLKHNKEVMVIDLLKETLSIDEDPYITSLQQPVEGLYLVGSFEPILEQGQPYYLYKDMQIVGNVVQYQNTPTIPDVTNVEALIKAKSDIFDAKGKLVITAKDLYKYSRHLKKKPTIPANAIKVAILVICNYLNSLCRYTNVKSPKYTLESLVKDEYHNLIYNEEYAKAYELTLDKVMEFVGKDTWHMYFYQIRGTSLVIEKTVDYRIYEWYRQKFEKEEDQTDEGLDTYHF